MRILHLHRRAFLLAFFVGLVCVLPSILVPISLGDQYSGVQYLPIDDEDIYRARIHEVTEGQIIAASPYLYEYKDASTPFMPVGEWFYAAFSFVFGISTTIVGSKFVLPALLFLLVYGLVRRLLGGHYAELTAITAGLLVVFGSEFVDYRSLISQLQGAWPRPILWTRLVNPIVGAVQLFGFLLLLTYVRESRWAQVAAGVVLATMVGYFFSFALALAILGVMFCVAIFQKEFSLAKSLCTVGAISVLLDARWWYNSLLVYGSGDAAGRAGVTYTHEPVINIALLAASVIAVAFFVFARVHGNWREHSRTWVFIFAALAASWLAFNQQVMTGRELWYPHFAQYTVPLALLTLALAAHLSISSAYSRLYRTGALLICTVCIVYGLFSVQSFVPRVGDLGVQQTYAPLFFALNSDACVVHIVSSEELERLIPAYTNCDVYSTSYVFSSAVARIEHNLFVQLAFHGVSAQNVGSYLREHPGLVRHNFYGNWTELFGSGLDFWIEERIEVLEERYGEFRRVSLQERLLEYRIDHIISESPLPEATLSELPAMRVDVVGRFLLYSL